MALINFDKDVFSSNSLNRLYTSTGIDNFSKNSIIRLMAESNATDVAYGINLSNQILTQAFVETATGQYLDAKGYDYGLSRNIIDKIIIFDTDQAITLEPITEGKTFGDYLTLTTNTIPADTQIATISSKFGVFTISDTTISLSDTSMYIGVYIEPIDKSTVTDATISLSEGDTITLSNLDSLGSVGTSLQLVIVDPIIIETANESDDDFRSRIVNAKTNLVQGTTNALSLLLDRIPNLLGYCVEKNTRNLNSLDINIVTQDLIDDLDYSYIPLLVNNLAENILPISADVLVKFPVRLDVYVEYEISDAETIPDDSIKETIKNVINTYYLYSTANTIKISELEAYVISALPDLLEFTVTNLYGMDSTIDEVVVTAVDSLVVPIAYYCYVETTDLITNSSSS